MSSHTLEADKCVVNFIDASAPEKANNPQSGLRLPVPTTATILEVSRLLRAELSKGKEKKKKETTAPVDELSLFITAPSEGNSLEASSNFVLVDHNTKVSQLMQKNGVGENGELSLYYFDGFNGGSTYGDDELELCLLCCACATALCACCAASEAVAATQEQKQNHHNNNNNNNNNNDNYPPPQQQYYPNQSYNTPPANTYGIPPNAMAANNNNNNVNYNNNNNAPPPATYGQPIYNHYSNEPGYGEAQYTSGAPPPPQNRYVSQSPPPSSGNWSCPRCTLVNQHNFCAACGEPKPSSSSSPSPPPANGKQAAGDYSAASDSTFKYSASPSAQNKGNDDDDDDDAKLPPPLYGNYKGAKDLD